MPKLQIAKLERNVPHALFGMHDILLVPYDQIP